MHLHIKLRTMQANLFCKNLTCPRQRNTRPFTSFNRLLQHLSSFPACNLDSHSDYSVPVSGEGRKRKPMDQSGRNQQLDNQDEVLGVAGTSGPIDPPSPSNPEIQSNDADFILSPMSLPRDDCCHESNSSPTNQSSPPKEFDPATNAGGMSAYREWIRDWIKFDQGESFESVVKCPSVSEDPTQTTLLRMLYTDPNYSPGWSICSMSEKAEVGLMYILNKTKGCPLYIYDSIVKWAKEYLQPQSAADQHRVDKHFEPKSGLHHDDNVLPLLRSRHQVLSHLEQWSNSKSMEPQTQTKFALLSTNRCVSLTTIPFCGSLYNLLTDDGHMQDCNLLINGKSPYDAPHPFPDNLNDINTGSRYIESYNHLKKSDIDFPLGILNFIDASNFDRGDRLSTEMVAYTITLFNRARRYQSSAWQSMGSIPNFKKTGHKSADQKVLDYHFILSFILGELESIQKCGGLLFPLKWQGKYHMVRFIPYILALLGDTPGQNALCGKMKSPSAKRLCRYCDIKKQHLSNPWIKSKLITKKMVANWQLKPLQLKEHSYKKVDIAWNRIGFGGCPYGAHGNCPGELLHTLNHGMMPVTMDGLFCCKAISAAARKEELKKQKASDKEKASNEENNEEEDDDSDDDEEEEDDDLLELVADAAKQEKIRQTREIRIKNGVFGNSLGLEMNYITLRVGRELQKQSDHDLPSVYFAGGVITRSKVAAHEQQGLCLLVLIVLCSTYAAEEGGISTKLGGHLLGGYISLLEALITLEEVMKSTRCDGFQRVDLPAIEYYTCVILDKLKKVVNRQEGDGHDTIKTHLLKHMAGLDIRKYGSPANVSGGPGESQFKDNFKLPASTTQKFEATFDQQVYTRHYQHLVLKRCAQNIKRSDSMVGSDLAESQEYHPSKDSVTIFNIVSTKHMGQNKDIDSQLIIDGKVGGTLYMVARLSLSNSESRESLNFDTEIVYTGRENTQRWHSFHLGADKFINRRGDWVGRKGCRSLTQFNKSFSWIASFFDEVLQHNDHLQIPLLTTLKVNDVLYRADPIPVNVVGINDCPQQERHDWVGLKCDEALTDVLPAQIISFIDVTQQLLEILNEHLPENQKIMETGPHALCMYCKNPLKNFFLPEMDLDPDQEMQPNCSLLAWEEKEVTRGRCTFTGKNEDIPNGRMVHTNQFVAPLIAISDFQPAFDHKNNKMKMKKWTHDSRSNSYTFLRPRKMWGSSFLYKARKAFSEK
jgi:hypothetical protein